MPAELIEAIAYLESWGDATAESPAGPKGIMQISEATARSMGLKVVHGTRYTITREKIPVKSKSKKPKYRIVTHKTPYQVTLRDDRLSPNAPYRRRRSTWRAWSGSSAGATGPFSPTTAARAA